MKAQFERTSVSKIAQVVGRREFVAQGAILHDDDLFEEVGEFGRDSRKRLVDDVPVAAIAEEEPESWRRSSQFASEGQNRIQYSGIYVCVARQRGLPLSVLPFLPFIDRMLGRRLSVPGWTAPSARPGSGLDRESIIGEAEPSRVARRRLRVVRRSPARDSRQRGVDRGNLFDPDSRQVATPFARCDDIRVTKTPAPETAPSSPSANAPFAGLIATQGVQPALAAFVVLILAVSGWVPHLSNSLLLDETLTAWVVGDGFSDVLDRTLRYQPQPAYNFFMWFWTRLAGTSEIALRIPSLLAALAACVALARLGSELTGDRETGLLAAIVLATSWNLYRESIDARSYMLGLIVLLGLALCLIRWIEHGRSRDAWLCGLLAALLPHLHFFFVLVYPALALYGWLRRADARWNRRQFAIVAAILVLGGLLYIPTALMLTAQGGSYSFVPPPRWRSLFEVFVWAPPVVGLLAGLSVAGVFGLTSPNIESDASLVDTDDSGPAKLSPACAYLMATWMLVPLVLLFVVSMMSELSVFLGRYLIPAIPAVCLFYALALRRIGRGPARVVAIIVMAFASLAIHDRPHDDFRGAAEAVNEFVAGDAAVPVLFASGLIEGEDVNWLRDPKLADYLNTPMKYYPVDGRVVTLPRRLRDHPMTNEIVGPILGGADRFAVVEWYGNGARATRWLLARAERAGYVSDPRSFGGVRVVFFSAKSPVKSGG